MVSRRHVTTLDDLSATELTQLGPLLGELTGALRVVTGCEKTYVAQFGEAEGFGHVHFHVIPRMPHFAEHQRGPDSLRAFLGAGERAVPEAEMDTIALQIRDALIA